MLLTETKVENFFIFKIGEKRATFNQANEFKSKISEKIRDGQIKIALDFSSVEFIDSTFLGSIINIIQQLTANDGDLRIFGMAESVANTIRVVLPNKRLKIYNNKSELLNAIEFE